MALFRSHIAAYAGVSSYTHDAGSDDDAAAVNHWRQTVFARKEGTPILIANDLIEDFLGIFGNRLDGAADARMTERHIDLPPSGNGL